MPKDISAVRIEPLRAEHVRGAFCCKIQKIENYCRLNVRKQNDAYMVRAFVAVEGECLDVLGFYYLCLTAYEVGEIDDLSEKKFERVQAVPAVYLGMIGVHSDHERAGVAPLLMRDALQRTLVIANNAGTYGLTLDALDDDLAVYYEDKYGFERFKDGGLEMFLTLGTIRASI